MGVINQLIEILGPHLVPINMHSCRWMMGRPGSSRTFFRAILSVEAPMPMPAKLWSVCPAKCLGKSWQLPLWKTHGKNGKTIGKP